MAFRRPISKWRPSAIVPQRSPAGTILDWRDFHAATAAHGPPVGAFERKRRKADYDGLLPLPPRRRWPDDMDT